MQNDPEARLQRIAATQHSVFSRAQALHLRISRKTIDRYVRCGRWIRLHAGVYISAGVPITWKQRLAAALLACGPDAVASHRGGGAAWGWTEDLFRPEVTVPSGTKRTHDGVLVHRTEIADSARRNGFRVTRPMRTLVDLATCIPEERIERIFDHAHRDGFIHPDRVLTYLSEPVHLSRPGSRVIRGIASARTGTPNASDLESIYFAALRKYGVPLPEPQIPVETRRGRKRMDFGYPEQMVAIELDSWEHHGSRDAFEADRPRRNELELLGWHVLQFTYRGVEADPVGAAVTTATALGLAPHRWRADLRRRRA